MNRWHRRFCASAAWAGFVGASLVPAVLSGLNLGDDVLEIGPGPGLTTEALVPQVRRLTVIEIDEVLSSTLSRRFLGFGCEPEGHRNSDCARVKGTSVLV
jgi:hypothetical protein